MLQKRAWISLIAVILSLLTSAAAAEIKTPGFVSELQTSWTMHTLESRYYTLPSLDREPQYTSDPELYINSRTGYTYPSFLTFNNATNTLQFSPWKIRDQQQGTYKFIIVVKQKLSTKIEYQYNCTVNITCYSSDTDCKLQVKYKQTLDEANLFISLTAPFRCDPNKDFEFCQRMIPDLNACCMRFAYVELDMKPYWNQPESSIINEEEQWLVDKLSKIEGAFPIKKGMMSVHICSSQGLLKMTDSVYVSKYSTGNGGERGAYQIGYSNNQELMPGLKGYGNAQCTYESAKILKVALGLLTLTFALILA